MEPRKRHCLAEVRQKKKPSPEDLSSLTSIDDLPEGTLTHILPSLTTTAAVKTSVVARAWRNLWHSVPILDFHMASFHCSRAPSKSIRHARQLFAEMLNQLLLQRPRHFSVEKFSLGFAYRNYDHIRGSVDSWLRYVIGAKAGELDLDFDHEYFYDRTGDDDGDASGTDSDEEGDALLLRYYGFHYSELVNSSVRVLMLNRCDLCMPSNALPIRIYSLRELHLIQLYQIQGEEIAHLLASCVNLQSLSIESAEFANNWKIAPQSLKHLKFECFNEFDPEKTSVEICAPNLESLSLGWTYNVKYSVKDKSSLIAADVTFHRRDWRDFVCWTNIVSSFGGIERLTIHNMWFWSLEIVPEGQRSENLVKSVLEVFSESFVFRNLKHVELLTGYSEDDVLGLQILLKRCPQLETMALVDNKYGAGDLKTVTDRSIVLQMPRLRLVEMKNFRKTESEMFVVGLLKKHARVLDKIVAYPPKSDCERRIRAFVCTLIDHI